jgi:hypothetical protein
MSETREDMLNRLTLAGWLVMVAHMTILSVLAPLVLVNVWPSLMQAGGRPAGYVMAGTFLVLGGVSFFACKWLLGKCGVVLVRPKSPSCESRDCR